MIELNRAVAVAEAHGVEAALAIVDGLHESASMQRYYLYHSTRADFLRRLERREEARAAYTRALALVGSPAESSFLKARLNQL